MKATTIRGFASIEEMNTDDVNHVLNMTIPQRIEYFRDLCTRYYKDNSDHAAWREYFRWLSLLDDQHLDSYIAQQAQ